MGALSQKSQTYHKAHIPDVKMPLRYGNISNVEYLDAHRIKKLQTNANKKKQKIDSERIKELETYYSMRRSSINTNDSPRRKLDISMVSVLFPNEQDKNIQNDTKKNSKKSILKKATRKRKLKVADAINGRDEKYLSQKRSRIKNVLSTIATIAIVFVMLSTVLIRYAEISNQTYLNAQTEKQLAGLKTELSKLDMDRALKEDLTSVQYAAASKGMSRPSENQVIFMAVNPELPDKYIYEDNTNIEFSDVTDENANNNSEIKNDKILSDTIESDSGNGPIEEFNSFFSRIGATLQGWFS